MERFPGPLLSCVLYVVVIMVKQQCCSAVKEVCLESLLLEASGNFVCTMLMHAHTHIHTEQEAASNAVTKVFHTRPTCQDAKIFTHTVHEWKTSNCLCSVILLEMFEKSAQNERAATKTGGGLLYEFSLPPCNQQGVLGEKKSKLNHSNFQFRWNFQLQTYMKSCVFLSTCLMCKINERIVETSYFFSKPGTWMWLTMRQSWSLCSSENL